MTKYGRARSMRAEGRSFAYIAAELGISLQWAYKIASGVTGDDAETKQTAVIRGHSQPQPTTRTVVKYHPHNGGCSSLSGMVPVSMPRIVALHGAAS